MTDVSTDYFDLSSYNPTSQKATQPSRHWQDERNYFVTHPTVYWTKLDIWNAFPRKTTTTQTLSNPTLTETLNMMRQPTTRLLSQQRLHLTIRNFWDYSTDLTTLRHTTRIDQQQGQLKTNLTTDKERCTWNFTLRRHYSWIRVEPSCHPPTQKDRVWLWFTASIYAGQSMRERDWLIDLYLNKVVPISIHFFTRKPYKFKKYLSIV